jgi:hypothetical protein
MRRTDGWLEDVYQQDPCRRRGACIEQYQYWTARAGEAMLGVVGKGGVGLVMR